MQPCQMSTSVVPDNYAALVDDGGWLHLSPRLIICWQATPVRALGGPWSGETGQEGTKARPSRSGWQATACGLERA